MANNSYLGVSTRKTTIIVNNKVDTVSGVENVSEQIRNLIEDDSDALGLKDYGMFLSQYKNLPLTSATALLVKRKMAEEIFNEIKSIDNTRFNISYTINTLEGSIDFLITFVVRSSYEEGSLVYPFYLNRRTV